MIITYIHDLEESLTLIFTALFITLITSIQPSILMVATSIESWHPAVKRFRYFINYEPIDRSCLHKLLWRYIIPVRYCFSVRLITVNDCRSLGDQVCETPLTKARCLGKGNANSLCLNLTNSLYNSIELVQHSSAKNRANVLDKIGDSGDLKIVEKG